ncbi:MAG TPA: SDR family NAD(P)-dependent oxidoreductase [Vicinamibacterales bacterium]|nr:SDR family NAD(P)-dependent oxidoreductase [Vicinamibacterales bacterium]
MASSRILVVGATGLLGGAIARQLIASGAQVRALGRNAAKLAALAELGAETVAVDLMDMAKVNEACRDVDQIVATANNAMGGGATSPGKIDLTAYQNLCAAARNARVRRLLYVSFRGVTSGETVDFFRIKWYIEDAIRRSGVPYVILRPSAFMETWINQVLAPRIRARGGALIFGDGSAVTNYIAVDDVATFAVRILQQPAIVGEAIDVGGPSDISLRDLATLVEKRLGAPGKRRHIPVLAMQLLPPLIRPFNEPVARMMSFGHYAATQARPFPKWRESAQRFGVEPRTVQAYVEAMK